MEPKKNLRKIVITGGSRGIGSIIARELAAPDCEIFLHFQSNKAKGEETAEAIREKGGVCHLIMGDLTSEEDRNSLVLKISAKTKYLTLVVQNAGTDFGKKIEAMDSPLIKHLVDLNLTAPIDLTVKLIPLLKRGAPSQVIFISSRLGRDLPMVGAGVYSATKAGLIQFGKSCALEFGEWGIRSNMIAPGLTDTDLTRGLGRDERWWGEAAKKNPSGRVGSPKDVANLVKFLASPQGEYINGEVIGVTGGGHLQP